MVSELTKIQVQFPWSTPKMIKNTHATYMQRRMCDGWKVLNMFRWTASYNQGRIQGGDRPDCPPKTTKVTLFTVILYKSENNIHDIRPFCSPLLCHSSVVEHTTFLLQQRSRYETWLRNITEIAPPPNLTDWIRPCCECHQGFLFQKQILPLVHVSDGLQSRLPIVGISLVKQTLWLQLLNMPWRSILSQTSRRVKSLLNWMK